MSEFTVSIAQYVAFSVAGSKGGRGSDYAYHEWFHTFSWLSRRMVILFDEYLGTEWRLDPSNPKVWERVDSIRMLNSGRLYSSETQADALINDKARAQWLTGEVHPYKLLQPGCCLMRCVDNRFARRFPTYKRVIYPGL